MNNRPSPLSIKLAKALFALSLLVGVKSVFTDGLGASVFGALLPAAGLVGLIYHFPWSRYYVIALFSIAAIQISWGGAVMMFHVAQSLYLQYVVHADNPARDTLPSAIGIRILLIIAPILVVAFFVWIIVDFLRNDRVKEYFVATDKRKPQSQMPS